MESLERTRLHWTEEQEIYQKLYGAIFSASSAIKVTGTSAYGDFRALKDGFSTGVPEILLIGCKNLSDSLLQEIAEIQKYFTSVGLVILTAGVKYEDLNCLHDCLASKRTPFAIFLKKSLTRSEQYYSVISLVKMSQVVIDPNLTAVLSTQKDRAALAGGLTAREMEILNLIAKGLTNVAIGGALCIEVKTVRHHINNIYSKLQTSGPFDQRHPRVSATNSYLRLTGQLTLEEGFLE